MKPTLLEEAGHTFVAIASIEILFCFGQWELDFLHHFQLVTFFILERKKLGEHFGSFFIAGIFEILIILL